MELVSVSEAQTLMMKCLGRLSVVSLRLTEALGRALAEPVRARDPVSPFDTSAMDGYALRAADTQSAPVLLRVVGTVPAGSVWPSPLGPGEAVRIMTGAPLPEGADAVIEQERVAIEAEALVRIDEPVESGRHVRRAGEDAQAGSVVLQPGTVLYPGAIALAAAAGRGRLAVYRPARVAVITTGDELLEPEEDLVPGKIRNTNRYLLEALIRNEGAEVVESLAAGDDVRALLEAFVRVLPQADMVLTTGGVSVGAFDCVEKALQKCDFQRVFWRVRQRPGKPLLFGLLAGKPFFGLPGNPVSTGVCFDQYVRPALRYMMGMEPLYRPRLRAILEEAFPAKKVGLHTFLRVRWYPRPDGRIGVRPTGPQGSHITHSLARATALAHLPESWGPVSAGTEVEVELWSAAFDSPPER
jgi:molybdopterin molybdotransferase